MKFKALSFIEVETPSKEYKTFLSQPFLVGNLFMQNVETIVLFTDWKGTDMGTWQRVVNPNNGVIIEFHIDEYKIVMRDKSYKFPYPKTLDHFISDCNRVCLDLFWNQIEMDKIFEMKIYLEEKQSKEYYKDLLTKIEKGNVY